MCQGNKSLADVLGNCVFKSVHIFKKKWLEFVDLLEGLGFSSCGHEKAAIVASLNRCVAILLMDGPATPGPVVEL